MTQKITGLLKNKELIREIGAFVLVGGSAFVVDTGTFYVMNSIFDFHHQIANLAGVTIGIIWTFFGHKYVTFRNKSDNIAKQGFQFLVVSVFGLSLQAFVLFLIVDVVPPVALLGDFQALFGKVVAVGVAAVSNFLFNKFWTFRKVDGADNN